MGTRTSVDLQGHTLNIETGGLIMQQSGSQVSNGQLAAGGGAAGELIVHAHLQTGTISADIVDDGGATALTIAGNAEVRLTGNNTYSGTTTAAGGRLTLQSPTAFPIGGDLTIANGSTMIDYAGATPIDVGQLSMYGSSSRIYVNGGAAAPAIDADSILLAGGGIQARLIGAGTLTKASPLFSRLTADNSGYTGQIIIEQGVLAPFADTSLGSGAVAEASGTIIQPGGILDLDQVSNTNEYIVLNGGTIDAGISGTVSGVLDVRADSLLRTRGGLIVNSTILSSVDLRVVGPRDGLANDGTALRFASPLGNVAGDLVVDWGTVALAADNGQFDGDIHLGVAQLIVEHADGLGTGTTHVGRSAVVVPRADGITGRIELAGGDLAPADADRTVLADVTVTDAARILGLDALDSIGPIDSADLHLAGSTTLADGVTLRKFGDGLLSFEGPLHIGQNTDLRILEGNVAIADQIIATGPVSSLEILGGDRLETTASIHVPAGETMAILVDGGESNLVIRGYDNGIGGGGTLIGNFELDGSADIEPGDSVGALTIDGNLKLTSTGGFLGELGGSGNSDLLVVTGTATVGGTLVLDRLDGYAPQLGDTMTIVSAGEIDGRFHGQDDIHGFDDAPAVRYTDTTVEVRITVRGDADFDDDVDISDFNTLATWFDPGGVWGAENTWSRGNFDGDRDIDITDFGTLATNFNPGGVNDAGAAESRTPADMRAVDLIVDLATGEVLLDGSAAAVSGMQVYSADSGLIAHDLAPAILQFVLATNPTTYAEGAFTDIAIDGQVSLGNLYNLPVDARDLKFEYTMMGRATVTGRVIYIPEPASLALLGICGLMMLHRRHAA